MQKVHATGWRGSAFVKIGNYRAGCVGQPDPIPPRLLLATPRQLDSTVGGCALDAFVALLIPTWLKLKLELELPALRFPSFGEACHLPAARL